MGFGISQIRNVERKVLIIREALVEAPRNHGDITPQSMRSIVFFLAIYRRWV